MRITTAVKDELSCFGAPSTCCRRAEVTTLLRLAGGPQILRGRFIVEAWLDIESTASRLRRAIEASYRYPAQLSVDRHPG